MKLTEFWKNFRLGEELSVSGAFIYNGMRRFHEMRKLDFTDEMFEVLYNLSVGLERVLKIAVVLLEHKESINQEDLEKSLITHNHLDLLARIKQSVTIKCASPHHDLLSLLGTFYKSLRYDRFTLSSSYNSDREINALCDLLRKHLGADIPHTSTVFGIENKEEYRQFIQRIVLKISQALYEVIKRRAEMLNLYTYELRSCSKAETVFLRGIQISEEDVLWKELLIFFMNTKSNSGYLSFLHSVTPLAFDPELISDYLDCFQSDASKSSVMDELEHLYGELDKVEKGERREMMGIIGAPNVDFGSQEDE